MTRLVFIGPPGAGKGTQAERLVRARNLVSISTGDLLRYAIKVGTPLGLRAGAAVDAGELVPDDIVIGLVEESLDQYAEKAGFILDGFPRTHAQAVALENLLASRNQPLQHVILFEIAIGLLEDRIARRSSQAQAEGVASRSDDNPNVLKRRIEEFSRATAALVPFYHERGLLRRIDARRRIDEVANDIARSIGIETTEELPV